ncbi:MAG TPA: 2-oxo acid dehydrogenase subunit E2, partial [Coxiellaceae bacterium]|nr:2-oxo acid dehydrogenase subunit E2 [Coxiellaceae bacterium]
DLILNLKAAQKAAAPKPNATQAAPKASPVSVAAAPSSNDDQYASPGVRRLAREFELDLKQIRGTGAKGRITREDVKAYVKSRLQSGGLGLNLAPAPAIDFSKFGEIETQDLSKIKKLSGANLSRNWVSIPHVTQFDEADITEMEAYRQASKDKMAAQGVKLTPLVFIMKAVVAALKHYPIFNSSLAAGGEQLILKKYYHLGVAVETPNGLMVPVIRDVDKKSPEELAKELATISAKAREKGLSIAEMQGSCFTITSLGGIGGTGFTPIINAPDVAILGVSRSQMKPAYQEGNFVPRLMLPLSLSYDHRVIDGADAARFIVYLSHQLSKMNFE